MAPTQLAHFKEHDSSTNMTHREPSLSGRSKSTLCKRLCVFQIVTEYLSDLALYDIYTKFGIEKMAALDVKVLTMY